MYYKGRKITIKELWCQFKKRIIDNFLFSVGKRVGYYIRPIHFYSPVPEEKDINMNYFDTTLSLKGIEVNEEKQIQLLKIFSENFKAEYNNLPKRPDECEKGEYYIFNNVFESVDGEILYCMVRHFKPGRIIEIGGGFSTKLFIKSIIKNMSEDEKYKCKFTTIEPYPSKELLSLKYAFFELKREKVQNIPLSLFSELRENDILFIDSSHVLKIGGDVLYEYLEILPSLNKGVIIHIHDIFLPFHYPYEWIIKKRLFWNEEYLLASFLSFNNFFEILWMGYYMHKKHSKILSEAFNSYNPHRVKPGSFWMIKIR